MSQKNKTASTSLFKKHPIGLSCALLTLVLVAVLFVRHGAIPSETAELEAKTAQGTRLKANISHSAQLAEQFDGLVTANGAKIYGRLVRPSELAKNQQYFYRLEAATGTKYNDLRPPPSTVIKSGMTNYVTVPYSVTVEGTFPQLLTYVRHLENGVTYCRIVSANLARATNDLSNQQLVLSLTLELLGQP